MFRQLQESTLSSFSFITPRLIWLVSEEITPIWLSGKISKQTFNVWPVLFSLFFSGTVEALNEPAGVPLILLFLGVLSHIRSPVPLTASLPGLLLPSHYLHALKVCNLSRRPIRLLAHSSDSVDASPPPTFMLQNVIDSPLSPPIPLSSQVDIINRWWMHYQTRQPSAQTQEFTTATWMHTHIHKEIIAKSTLYQRIRAQTIWSKHVFASACCHGSCCSTPTVRLTWELTMQEVVKRKHYKALRAWLKQNRGTRTIRGFRYTTLVDWGMRLFGKWSVALWERLIRAALFVFARSEYCHFRWHHFKFCKGFVLWTGAHIGLSLKAMDGKVITDDIIPPHPCILTWLIFGQCAHSDSTSKKVSEVAECQKLYSWNSSLHTGPLLSPSWHSASKDPLMSSRLGAHNPDIMPHFVQALCTEPRWVFGR